jgi:hypothetical protein
MAEELRVHEDYAPDPETVRLFYEHVKDAPELLIRDGDDLDRKGIALLSAASVLLGLASFGKFTSGAAASTSATIFLVLAGGGYLFAAFFTFRLLRPTTYVRSKHADDLWDEGKWATPTQLMEFLISSAKAGYIKNKIIVDRKAGSVTKILAGTAFEVVAVVAAVVAAHFS